MGEPNPAGAIVPKAGRRAVASLTSVAAKDNNMFSWFISPWEASVEAQRLFLRLTFGAERPRREVSSEGGPYPGRPGESAVDSNEPGAQPSVPVERATHGPVGENARKDDVRERSQLQIRTMGQKKLTKRSKQRGLLPDQKQKQKGKSRGVRRKK
jgi:hypothetical protein